MSRSSRNFSTQENWQPGQEDFWLYPPPARTGIRTSHHLYPRVRSQGPWWPSEETSLGGPINYGLPSFPSSAPPRSSLQLVLMDEYNTYPRAQQNHTPHGNQITALEEESRWSNTEEEQKQAAISSKLRKQLYSPHMTNIVKRLGTSKSTGSSSSSTVNKKYDDDDDDDGKRCAVCLDDFVTKEFVTVTPCNHMFHEECIIPWVKTSKKCPVCRFLIAP